MEKRYLSVQEVAARLAISKQTLLRYERKGVFPEPKRNRVNGWREYTNSDLDKMKRILGRDDK
jgi:DNA-binding transcriptional MerR regulator